MDRTGSFIGARLGAPLVAPATTTVAGTVIVPTSGRLTVDGSGNVSVPLASAGTPGVAKVGTGLTISGGDTLNAVVSTLGYQLLASQTVSSPVAVVDFTSSISGADLLVVWDAVQFGTPSGGDYPVVKVTADGGSTWVQAFKTSANQSPAVNLYGNVAITGCNTNFSVAHGMTITNATSTSGAIVGATLELSGPINGVRCTSQSGTNFASGTFNIYGR